MSKLQESPTLSPVGEASTGDNGANTDLYFYWDKWQYCNYLKNVIVSYPRRLSQCEWKPVELLEDGREGLMLNSAAVHSNCSLQPFIVWLLDRDCGPVTSCVQHLWCGFCR